MLNNAFDNSVKSLATTFFDNSIVGILPIPIIRLSYPEFNIIGINEKAKEELPKFMDNEPKPICDNESIVNFFSRFRSEENMKHIQEMKITGKAVPISGVKFEGPDKTIYVNLIYQPVLNSEGNIVEMLIIAFDITSEVEKNNNLEELMKMQERFFSFISHEFKTPLTVINSAIQAMQSICGDELSDTSKRFIKQIHRSTLQQLRLVNNLLDISRSEAGYLKVHKKNVDIVALTRTIVDSVALFAGDKGVNLSLESAIQDKKIAVDDEKYERILLNLLSNAIKFTPRGKSIYVCIYQRKNRVCVEVRDEGIGIPKSKQNIVFERFKQVENSFIRTSEGTGIGLCLVKMLVKALNGKITLSSEEGKGSIFTVYLPDALVDESGDRGLMHAAEHDRLVQAANIEFSSIYLDQ